MRDIKKGSGDLMKENYIIERVKNVAKICYLSMMNMTLEKFTARLAIIKNFINNHYHGKNHRN